MNSECVDPDTLLVGVLENLIEIAKRVSSKGTQITFYQDGCTSISYFIGNMHNVVHAETIRGCISLMADYHPNEFEKAKDEYTTRNHT